MNDNTMLIPQVFEHEEFGRIRGFLKDGEPWFVGKDICTAFGDTNHKRSLARLDDEDKSLEQVNTNGGVQNMIVVNESGLYTLLFYMQPQKAKGVSQNDPLLEERIDKLKRFRRWVTSEVLPSIRKTGGYGQPISTEITPTFLRNIANQLENYEIQLVAKDQQIAELQPKASYYDVVLNCEDAISVTALAKDYGWSAQRMNQELAKRGIQYKQGGHWFLYQKYAEHGYTCTKTHTYLKDDGTYGVNIHTYWTPKGRLFIYELLKEDGILPLIELQMNEDTALIEVEEIGAC